MKKKNIMSIVNLTIQNGRSKGNLWAWTIRAFKKTGPLLVIGPQILIVNMIYSVYTLLSENNYFIFLTIGTSNYSIRFTRTNILRSNSDAKKDKPPSTKQLFIDFEVIELNTIVHSQIKC